jgi:hypothetical protein
LSNVRKIFTKNLQNIHAAAGVVTNRCDRSAR